MKIEKEKIEKLIEKLEEARHGLEKELSQKTNPTSAPNQELGNVETDISMLKNLFNGKLELGREQYLRRVLPEFESLLSRVNSATISIRAELAMIERVKALLK